MWYFIIKAIILTPIPLGIGIVDDHGTSKSGAFHTKANCEFALDSAIKEGLAQGWLVTGDCRKELQ
jgi:hypothetical protein